jgi:hypothetical protein
MRRRIAVLICGALALAACSSSESPVSVVTPPSFTGVPTTTTEVPPDATSTSIVEVATTAPPSSAAPATPPPTVPESTTTTEPLSVQELLLRGDGIGFARFGGEPEGVISYVASVLGGNTGDTGWVEPFAFAQCFGTVARRVDWGVLSLLFTDESGFATGRRHFIGWEYGRLGQIGDEPVGLRTPGGVTLGSRVVDLLAEFPDAAVNPGEQDINIPPNFYVSDVFYGLLTGAAPDDVVTVMFGGDGCGE